MKRLNYRIKNLIYLFLVGMLICSCSQNVITIDDSSGALRLTNAPVSVKIKLNESKKNAAKKGRLGIVELSTKSKSVIHVQVENSDNGGKPDERFSEESWDAYHKPASPTYTFKDINN